MWCCWGAAANSLVSDDGWWQRLAECKWGAAVTNLKALADAQQPTSWRQYCSHRMCLKSVRPSPLQLIQEGYPDVWQHIIACVLVSRTTGSDSIRAAIARFFAVFPTPTVVLAADEAIILSALHPLGLQAVRCSAVKAVSHDLLARHWHDPSDFRGCGKFVSDSWRIFCRGERDARGIDDCKLKAWLAGVNKAGSAAAAGTSRSRPAADSVAAEKAGKVRRVAQQRQTAKSSAAASDKLRSRAGRQQPQPAAARTRAQARAALVTSTPATRPMKRSMQPARKATMRPRSSMVA